MKPFLILLLVVASWLALPTARTFAAPAPFAETSMKAEQGDPIAQYNLGTMYQGGQGVPQDYAEAVKWYRKSADQGYAAAETRLAGMYRGGYGGLSKDDVEAHNLYLKAAAQGDPIAKFSLALERFTPATFVRGLPQKYRDTIFWTIVALPVAIFFATFIFSAALLLSRFTKIAGTAKYTFGTYCKVSTIYATCIVVLMLLVFLIPQIKISIAMIVFAIGIGITFGKLIKHPETGPIGYRKGGLVFAGLTLWLVALSVITLLGFGSLLQTSA